MRYPARVNVDVIYCELCNNPYRRAAGACDNCGQSGAVDWDALADEARSLRGYVIGGFGLALLGLVITFTASSSEYVRELIRKDQQRAQLRALLVAGVTSKAAAPATPEYFAALRTRVNKAAKSAARR